MLAEVLKVVGEMGKELWRLCGPRTRLVCKENGMYLKRRVPAHMQGPHRGCVASSGVPAYLVYAHQSGMPFLHSIRGAFIYT